MEGQQKQTKKKRRPFPWIRAIAALVTSLLLSALAILLILSTVHVIAAYWLVVIPIIFTVFGQLLPLWQWLFPVSAEAKDDQPTTIWNVPYLRNRCFTGREELLKRLHDNFTNRKAAALTQAITGLGGIGKVNAQDISHKAPGFIRQVTR